MRVAMIGAGYVGLVSGACFADFGHQVACIDKDAARIGALKRGEIPIFEPGLAELVESNVRQGRLEFGTEASRAGEAEAVFIAVGSDDDRARKVLTEIYRPLYLNAPPIIFVSRRTAELIKYASNAFLATKITFINEMADLCEQVGADVQEVARGMGLDNRIGAKFLHAGPGFGGSCFPKDTSALIKTAHDHGVPLRVVETVSAVNEQRKRAMARKVVQALGGSVRGKTVAVLGLTFKPNTDDTRDSLAIPLITALHDLGAAVRGYDPAGMEQAKPLLPDVHYCQSAYSAAEDADAVVIATEWEQFRALDLGRLKKVMTQPVIVDLRNIYRSDEMRRAAFRYIPVGRAGVE